MSPPIVHFTPGTTLPNAMFDRSKNVGLTAVPILAAAAARKYLLIHNPSKTAFVYLSIDTTVPVAGGLGVVALGPLGTYYQENQTCPSNAFNAISDTANTPLTIWERPS